MNLFLSQIYPSGIIFINFALRIMLYHSEYFSVCFNQGLLSLKHCIGSTLCRRPLKMQPYIDMFELPMQLKISK